MKKITFPKLDVELYEEILPNKMKVLVCPNPSADVVKAGVYVDIGSYNHTEKIQSTKQKVIPTIHSKPARII